MLGQPPVDAYLYHCFVSSACPEVHCRSRISGTRSGFYLLFGSLTAIGLVAGGCSLPMRSVKQSVDPARLDDVRFLHYLATVPAVTVDEGMRGVLLVSDIDTNSITFSERSAALQRMAAIRPEWELERDRLLDQGTLAYMLCVLCDLPRSINQKLAARLGMGERRYALKVCVDAGLMPYGLPHAPVSGGALLSALTAAERLFVASGSQTP